MDILPLLAEVIRTFVPAAPLRQKVAFAMEKGGILDLPVDLGCITVGLGWDTDEGEVDLDVSAVLLNREGKDVEAVFFGRLESDHHGIQHTGDNLTGEGEGDDEQIKVNLNQVGIEVEQVVFCVNIYTSGMTFVKVARPYCRAVDSTGMELCRFSLRETVAQNGLIIAKLAREAGGRWGFHALGVPCRGTMYKDSLPEIREVCKLKTASLMARNTSSESLASFGDNTSSLPAAAHVPQSLQFAPSAPAAHTLPFQSQTADPPRGFWGWCCRKRRQPLGRPLLPDVC